MKQLLSLLLLFTTLITKAQFTTKDSTVSFNPYDPNQKWNCVLNIPTDYATNNNPYTAIIYFPGLGEVGTDVRKMYNNGVQKYITTGRWNGNVTVDNKTTKFIIIGIQPKDAYPGALYIDVAIQAIKKKYRLGSIHLTGLSHGGWMACTYVTGDPYGGAYTYASQICSVVNVEGVIPNKYQPYPNIFENFALAGGRLLGFEQVNDPRDMQTYINVMNAKVPNSGIYVKINFGNVGHCCWDNFYGGSAAPNKFTLDGISQNIYEWMARRSAPPNQPPSVNAGTDQTITLPQNYTSLNGSATDSDGTIASYTWTKTLGTGGTITSPNLPNTAVTGLSEGNYVFTLTATDNGNLSSSKSVNITVKPKPKQITNIITTTIYDDGSFIQEVQKP